MMEQPPQPEVQVQQPLKCPRCDSSNTKFCYYNNYSLSQPRHFCKACKRYWTRGGTLRNVPVGGGCRKNKRVKTANSVGHEIASGSSAPIAAGNPSFQSFDQVDVSLSSTGSHINNPFLYSSLTRIPLEPNLPYSMRDGYDLRLSQFNGGELGFFGSITSQNLSLNNGSTSVTTSNPRLSSYDHIFGTSSVSTSSMGSLLASSLQHQTSVSSGIKDIAQKPYGFMGFDDVQTLRNGESFLLAKDVKMEGHGNRLGRNIATDQNPIEEINSSHPSFVWNSPGVWLDGSSLGSSVPSLM